MTLTNEDGNQVGGEIVDGLPIGHYVLRGDYYVEVSGSCCVTIVRGKRG